MPGNENIGAEEFAEVKHLFDNGACLFRHGYDQSRNGIYKVSQFEKNFSAHMGVEYSLAVSSGTAALRVALAALDIGNGDEVITQSFTFVATSEAIIEAGATPVFTNISSNLNMCPLDLANKITPNTKAIIVVHMLGVPCSMTEIMHLANQKGIPVIEDTAWGCGGKYDANHLGTIGRMGTYSFDHAKLMTTGEGGMIVFQHKEDYEKAAAWHDHGHENNPHLPRWKDSRSSSGFNYRMSELQGAVGLAQLKKLNSFVKRQRENALSIIDELRTVNNLKIRSEPAKAFSTFDAVVFQTRSPNEAEHCRQALINKGLSTKILPEAITWHFAGLWEHMPQISKDNVTSLEKSKFLLQSCVSIPVLFTQQSDYAKLVKETVEKIVAANDG